jgi:V/A-type H+-transporting ATPase subunit C
MMATDVSGYAAIHSRVRIMFSGLLTPHQGSLLRESTNLPGLIAVLKTTAYGPYLTATDDKELTARQTETQLRRKVADAYMAVIHSAPGHARALLVQGLRHFEVRNLKTVLRGIVIGSTWEQIQDILFPLGSFSVLPAQQMLEAGNIEAAVAQLSGTPYFETLTQALKRYASEQSLFPLEIALDLNYWRKLWGAAAQLPGQDHAQAARIIGTVVDVTNLMWALRYHSYYHLSEEEVINYTLPFGHHVRDEDIRAIAAGADAARVVERLYPGMHNVEAMLLDPERGLPKLELELQRRMRQQFIAVFESYPFTIGLALALVQLSELELQDLTVLIEAKASQMPAEEYVPYLLMGENLNEKASA